MTIIHMRLIDGSHGLIRKATYSQIFARLRSERFEFCEVLGRDKIARDAAMAGDSHGFFMHIVLNDCELPRKCSGRHPTHANLSSERQYNPRITEKLQVTYFSEFGVIGPGGGGRISYAAIANPTPLSGYSGGRSHSL